MNGRKCRRPLPSWLWLPSHPLSFASPELNAHRRAYPSDRQRLPANDESRPCARNPSSNSEAKKALRRDHRLLTPRSPCPRPISIDSFTLHLSASIGIRHGGRSSPDRYCLNCVVICSPKPRSRLPAQQFQLGFPDRSGRTSLLPRRVVASLLPEICRD